MSCEVSQNIKRHVSKGKQEREIQVLAFSICWKPHVLMPNLSLFKTDVLFANTFRVSLSCIMHVHTYTANTLFWNLLTFSTVHLDHIVSLVPGSH